MKTIKWLLYAAGWTLIGIWILWQPPWSIYLGLICLLVGMVVAGGKDGTGHHEA